MCSIVSIGGENQWGSVGGLVAVGKELFMWCEVLVLMGRDLLPERAGAVGGRKTPEKTQHILTPSCLSSSSRGTLGVRSSVRTTLARANPPGPSMGS